MSQNVNTYESTSGLNQTQIIGLVGSAAIGLGVFLPFAKVLNISISFIDGADGVLILIAAIVAALLFFTKRYTAAGIVGLFAGLVCVYDASNLSELGFAQLGVGIYVICIGAIIILYASVTGVMQKKQENSHADWAG